MIAYLASPGTLERIALPILLLSAGQDKLVDPATHAPIVKRLQNARLSFYEDAQHEIMMEIDPIRAKFWADFDAFAATVKARA